MTLLEVAFQMIILTYIRVANADEVTYESFVENVMILSEIIHIWENILADLIRGGFQSKWPNDLTTADCETGF